MGVAVLKGYENANGKALDLWEEVYPDVLLLALTDTFSTEVFYKVAHILCFTRMMLNRITLRTSYKIRFVQNAGKDFDKTRATHMFMLLVRKKYTSLSESIIARRR